MAYDSQLNFIIRKSRNCATNLPLFWFLLPSYCAQHFSAAHMLVSLARYESCDSIPI